MAMKPMYTEAAAKTHTEYINTIRDASLKHPNFIELLKSNNYTGTFELVDGMILNKRFAEFYKEIKKIYPSLRVFVVGSYSFSTVTELALAFPANMYVAGKIGVSGEGDYYVASSHIKNYRFRSGSEGHNTLSTGDLKKAIKNFRTYIRPADMRVDLENCAVANSAIISEVCNAAMKDLNVTTRALIDDPDLVNELVHLVQSGHKFFSKTVQENANKMLTFLGEAREEVKMPFPHQMYVRCIENTPGNEEFEIMDLGQMGPIQGTAQSFPIRLAYNVSARAFQPKTIFVRDAPDWMKDKISALNMMESNKYVRGLGLKRGEMCFFVDVAKDEVLP
jgi:hypothetical protein